MNGRGDGHGGETSHISGRPPGYDAHPEYEVTLEPTSTRVRVVAGGRVIAETDAAMRVRETGHEPLYYVPLEDIDWSALERSTHTTWCPFKGDASYWNVVLRGGERIENVLWCYERPYSRVAALGEYAGFYAERVEHFEVRED